MLGFEVLPILGVPPLSCQSMMPNTSVLVHEMMMFVIARSVCVNRIEEVSEKDERKVRGLET